MCLEIEVNFPNRILEKGHYCDIEYIISHNGMGIRCGYVKLQPGHLYYDRSDSDLSHIDVHGGITFAEKDVDCGKANDNGFWIGFDCGHYGDAPDYSLPCESGFYMPTVSFLNSEVRNQEYVRNECFKLCREVVNTQTELGSAK